MDYLIVYAAGVITAPIAKYAYNKWIAPKLAKVFETKSEA